MSFISKLSNILASKESKQLREQLNQANFVETKIDSAFKDLHQVYWYYNIESLRKQLHEVSNINMKAKASEILNLLNKYNKIHVLIKDIYDSNPKKLKKFKTDLAKVDSFFPATRKSISQLLQGISEIESYKDWGDLVELEGQLKILLIKVKQLERDLVTILPKEQENPHQI